MILSMPQMICFPGSTEVTMADGGLRRIDQIVPGEEVMGTDGAVSVARITRTPVVMADLDVAVFQPGSLGDGAPNRRTVCTVHHPILYRGTRYEAAALADLLEGVSIERVRAADEFPVERDGRSWMYNLQAQHETFFIANGLVSQTHSPWHSILPLPSHLRASDDVETRHTCDALTLPQNLVRA